MSGGSYEYGYLKVRDMAEDERLREGSELRRRFAAHLERVATAMHAVEWVDSSDWGKGDDEQAIRDVLGDAAPLDRQSDRRAPSRSKARDTSMTLQALAAGVRETLAYGGDLRTDALHMAFGLAEESGEVAGKFKRVLRGDPGASLTDSQWLAAVSGEIGDTLWYVVALADVLGLSMDDVAAQLLEKTRSRKARGVLLGSGDSR